jgi:transcriptional regulator with XRE-family HTH domain
MNETLLYLFEQSGLTVDDVASTLRVDADYVTSVLYKERRYSKLFLKRFCKMLNVKQELLDSPETVECVTELRRIRFKLKEWNRFLKESVS